jgi:hypothetical protein
MLSIGLLLVSAAAQAVSSEAAWSWDNDDPGCSLEQHTDDGPLASVSRVPGQDATAVSFNVRTPRFWKGLYGNATVTLSTGESFPATAQVYSIQNRQYELRADVNGSAFLDALSKSYTVTVADPDFGKFPVRLRKLASAVAALRSCENDRMRDWGIDVASYWALASRPRPIGHLVDLFSSDNYPTAAGMAGVQRNVIAKVEVGADGSVTACNAPNNFPYPQFVDSVCGVLRKSARFEPARDQNGKTVSAPYVVIVSFRLR